MVRLKIKEIDDKEVLWRYLDFPKFVSLIANKEIWLPRVDKFRDKHEGRIPVEMMQNLEKIYDKKYSGKQYKIRTAEEFEGYIRKNTYISCWHRNIEENMAMWEIYGKDNCSLAIQTTVRDIGDAVDTSNVQGELLILKPVAYKNPDEIDGDLNYEDCAFFKRRPYAYENEVRISLDCYSTTNPSKNTPEGKGLSCDVSKLINRIILHPDCEIWFQEVVRKTCSRFKFTFRIEKGYCSSV